MPTPAELYPHLPGVTTLNSLLCLQKKVEELVKGTLSCAAVGTADEWEIADAEVIRCCDATDKLTACLLGILSNNESSHLR
jgi:hypothetical protein